MSVRGTACIVRYAAAWRTPPVQPSVYHRAGASGSWVPLHSCYGSLPAKDIGAAGYGRRRGPPA